MEKRGRGRPRKIPLVLSTPFGDGDPDQALDLPNPSVDYVDDAMQDDTFLAQLDCSLHETATAPADDELDAMATTLLPQLNAFEAASASYRPGKPAAIEAAAMEDPLCDNECLSPSDTDDTIDADFMMDLIDFISTPEPTAASSPLTRRSTRLLLRASVRMQMFEECVSG